MVNYVNDSIENTNKQIIYSGYGSYQKIEDIINAEKVKKVMLVCGKSYEHMFIKSYIEKLECEIVKFNSFSPNPLYEQVVKGVDEFLKNECEMLISIGGGSAIDVAKCIKLFSRMNSDIPYLEQPYVENTICHLSIPTTAGTGSESTKFAVCYYKGIKQSVTHDSILPKYVILEPELLKTLPLYQKKVTMLDALCQSIESIWSVNSNSTSRHYAISSVRFILENYEAYLNGDSLATEVISRAANLSGKAISITQTTAAHAMSYKLTSLYGLPHGHAVAICLGEVWRYLYKKSCDTLNSYVTNALEILNACFNVSSTDDAINKFCEILNKLCICFENELLPEDLEKLVISVNPMRLKNMPIQPSIEDIRNIYILSLTKNI